MIISLVFAVILGVLAFFALLVALCEAEFGALVLAVVFAASSAALGYHADHSINVARNNTHAAIYSDLKRQGYDIASTDIHATTGSEIMYAPQVVYNVGGCAFLLDLDKYNGVWKVDVQQATNGAQQGGYHVLPPAALKKLAAVCETK